MPYGKGTYGSQRGRPPKKKSSKKFSKHYSLKHYLKNSPEILKVIKAKPKKLAIFFLEVAFTITTYTIE